MSHLPKQSGHFDHTEQSPIQQNRATLTTNTSYNPYNSSRNYRRHDHNHRHQQHHPGRRPSFGGREDDDIPTTVNSPSIPTLVSPSSASRGKSSKSDNTNQMDDGTKVLISQLVATDMARQDYKEKVCSLGVSSGSMTTPVSPKNIIVKQRPPPPHRTNSSSQHSLRSSTHHSSTSNSSQHPYVVSPEQYLTKTPSSMTMKVRPIIGAQPMSSWNDPSLIRTPSPHREPISTRLSQPQPNPPYLLSPTINQQRHVHHSNLNEQHPNPVTPQFSPHIERRGTVTSAFHAVSPTTPYKPPTKQFANISSTTPYGKSPANLVNDPTTTRISSSSTSADIMLQEAKRREREQGPLIASSGKINMKKKEPPSRLMSLSNGMDVYPNWNMDVEQRPHIERNSAFTTTGPSLAHRSTHQSKTDRNDDRKSSNSSVPTGSSTTSKKFNVEGVTMKDDLAEVKRRERDRGPMLSSSATPRKSRVDRSNKSVLSTTSLSNQTSLVDSCHNLVQNKDDMHEAKRRERERGPSLFSAMITPRHNRQLSSKKDNTVESTKAKTPSNTRLTNSGGTNTEEDINDIKRRERASGPALSSATGSVVQRRRAATRQLNQSNDSMEDVKRRERERGTHGIKAPAFVVNTPPRTAGNNVPSSVTSKPKKSSKDNRVGFEVDDDDDASTDSAYALAMARTNLERKLLQDTALLRGQESAGQSIASATGNAEIHPGAVAFIGQEMNAKADDNGPTIAPARGLTTQRVSPRSPSRMNTSGMWSNTDIEAQAGVPIVTPGAFAVHGVSSQASDYTSSEESDDDIYTDPIFGVDENGIDGTLGITPDTPLEAEVYEQVVLDGAVVPPSDEEEEEVDPKVLKRLRFVQISILAFALCAIGVIIGSILGFASKNNSEGPIQVQGWNQSGGDIFGRTDEPQTLFGNAIAMSGDGQRIAIASPGSDNGTTLNVGEVYIMESKQNENGTFWDTIDVLVGPGPSNDVKTSIAMTPDSKWLAIGYARHVGGSQVQVYQEVDSLWKPQSLPIIDVNGTDSTWFGYALDISNDGTIITVGAPQMDSPSNDGSGAVQVYQKNENNEWIQMGSNIYGITSNEFFGWAISSSTTIDTGRHRIAVGAPVSNDTTGVVRVYEWDNTDWIQVGVDLVGDVPLNRFGESVALSDDGSVLVVGIRGTAFETGQIKVFRDNKNGIWELDDMSFLGAETGEGFGASVAITGDGNVLVVGGPQNSLFGDSAGIISVYRYDASGKSWTQQGSYIGSVAATEFGVSVAISNDGLRVAGGAPSTTYDGSIAQAGSVLIFDSVGSE
jgi:hypothetical protein